MSRSPESLGGHEGKGARWRSKDMQIQFHAFSFAWRPLPFRPVSVFGAELEKKRCGMLWIIVACCDPPWFVRLTTLIRPEQGHEHTTAQAAAAAFWGKAEISYISISLKLNINTPEDEVKLHPWRLGYIYIYNIIIYSIYCTCMHTGMPVHACSCMDLHCKMCVPIITHQVQVCNMRNADRCIVHIHISRWMNGWMDGQTDRQIVL